jgi:hypothetical protein
LLICFLFLPDLFLVFARAVFGSVFLPNLFLHHIFFVFGLNQKHAM